MKYVGMVVHVKATVWCCLEETGEIVERGKLPTTADHLTRFVVRLLELGEVLFGQEAGKMSHFVHDVVTIAGGRPLTFLPPAQRSQVSPVRTLDAVLHDE